MKPSDAYAMPSIDGHEWYHAPDSMLLEVFGMREWEVSRGYAAKSGSDRVRFERKMTHVGDTGHGSVYVVTLDGSPFGVYVNAGDAKGEFNAFYCTDADALRSAQAIARECRSGRKYGGMQREDAEMAGLDLFRGVSLVRDGSGFRMVDARFSDRDGTLLFDEALLGRAYAGFHERHGDRLTQETILADPAIRREAAEAVRAAIPQGVHAVLIDEIGSRHGREGDDEWVVAVAGTEQGAHYVTIPLAYLEEAGFPWHRCIACERRDGNWILEKLAERYADRNPPAPTPAP